MANISKIQIGNNTYDIKDANVRNDMYNIYAVRHEYNPGDQELSNKTSTTIKEPLGPGIVCQVYFSNPQLVWADVKTPYTFISPTNAWQPVDTPVTSSFGGLSTLYACFFSVATSLKFTVQFASTPGGSQTLNVGLGWGYSKNNNDDNKYWNADSISFRSSQYASIKGSNYTTQHDNFVSFVENFNVTTLNSGDGELWSDNSKGIRFAPMIKDVNTPFLNATVFKVNAVIRILALVWGKR